MSPQQRMALSFTKRLLLFIIFGATTTFLINGIYALGPSQAQRTNTKEANGKPFADKEPPSERKSFTENGPPGRWSASIIPDLTRNSSTSPVIIIGNSTLMGNAHWRNLQLTHVTLKNYSAKTVLAVQIKWFITTRTNPTDTLPPPGYTGLFEAHLLSGVTEKVESPLIKFSQVIKYQIKNGTLDGDFLVHVKVYQVEFEDGTSWNDDWGGPKHGDQGEPWRGARGQESLQNHATFALQAPCASPAASQPRLYARVMVSGVKVGQRQNCPLPHVKTHSKWVSLPHVKTHSKTAAKIDSNLVS